MGTESRRKIRYKPGIEFGVALVFVLLSVLFLCIAYLPRPGYGITEGTVVSVGKRTQVSPRKGLPGETSTKVSCTFTVDGKKYTAEYSTRKFPQKGDRLEITYKKDRPEKTRNPYHKTENKQMAVMFLISAMLVIYAGIVLGHMNKQSKGEKH